VTGHLEQTALARFIVAALAPLPIMKEDGPWLRHAASECHQGRRNN